MKHLKGDNMKYDNYIATIESNNKRLQILANRRDTLEGFLDNNNVSTPRQFRVAKLLERVADKMYEIESTVKNLYDEQPDNAGAYLLVRDPHKRAA